MKISRKSILAACAIPTTLFFASSAQSQEFFVGQIIYMGGNFCPEGTLQADGSVLPIIQFQVLYSLFGTTYGGDGTTNFKLPAIPSSLSGTRYCVVFNGLYPIRPVAVAKRKK